MKCYGCGIEKDLSKEEIYPFPEEHRLCTDPIPPLFVLECEIRMYPSPSKWKAVVVCHNCFSKLNPDMWISDSCWNSLNPIIPIDKLPDMRDRDELHEWENPKNYPDLVT